MSQKPFILVMGCRRYYDMLMEAIDHFTDKLCSCITLGVVGDPDVSEAVLEGQVLKVPVEDTWEALPKKVYAAFDWVLRNVPDTIGVFKTDDDIRFFELDKLFASLYIFRDSKYHGLKVDTRKPGPLEDWRVNERLCDKTVSMAHTGADKYCWGAGYWLSNESLRRVVAHQHHFDVYGMEDQIVGRLLNEHGVIPQELVMHYRELRRQKIPLEPTSKIIRITFMDFWDTFDATFNFFLNLLNASGSEYSFVGSRCVSPDTDLIVYSVFGTTNKKITMDIPKVYFSGEPRPVQGDPMTKLYLTSSLMPEFSGLLGEDSKVLNLPLWLFSVDWWPETSADEVLSPFTFPLGALTSTIPYEAWSSRESFCSFVVSNGANAVRNEFFENLSRTIEKVRSGGKYLNNIGAQLDTAYPNVPWELAKYKFLECHRFDISFENSLAPGYVTEKLLQAKVAGCIPIYWGGAIEGSIRMDPDGYLDVSDCETTDAMVERVRTLMADEASIRKMLSTPALTPKYMDEARQLMAKVSESILQVVISTRSATSATSAPSAPSSTSACDD